jgi:hypothetical protein
MSHAPTGGHARPLLRFLLAGLLAAPAAFAAGPPCQPCAGIVVDDPSAWLSPLAAAPALSGEAQLYVVWATAPDPAAAAATREVAARGAVPWLQVQFATPAPLLDHVAQLDTELEALSALVRAADPATHYQIDWPGAAQAPGEYAFLLKRAAVAVTGAQAGAPVITTALPADPAALEALYAEEIAAYVDGVALAAADGEALTAALAELETLDPGKSVVLMAAATPRPAARAVAEAARWAAAGVAVTLFPGAEPTAEALAPLKVLALEFQGEDLAYDPYSAPPGVAAWAFVRGEDLALRVIVDRAGGVDHIVFADTTLRQPTQVDVATDEAAELFGIGRTASGLSIPLDGEGPVAILRLERPDLADLVGEGGLAEEVTITGDRSMPVAEILRRLQANEDAQTRRLAHYEATNTTHLRFQGSSGVQSVEATFEGSFFFERGKPFDWAWQTFYVNGVKWRSKKIPEIPLIEPDRAATLPLAINFDRDYAYRLRGTDVVDGRDCWVVDFAPAADAAGNRYQGTVWIDRQLFLRVRSRGLQVGLTGDVISNEETLFYTPLDADGAATSWEDAAFTLPLRVVSQQIFSVLNATTNVEKEVLLSDLAINADGFDDRRQATYDSDATVVRDTADGLRYLVVDKDTGQRVVQDEFDKDRLFLVGGTFYDESLDYPLPLAGINYFSFDFRGTGNQANLFFAGVLALGNLSDPNVLGSRWDAGASLLGIAIPFTNSIYQDGVKATPEDVDVQVSSLDFTVGRPIGNFVKLNLDYQLGLRNYSRTKETADDFVIPQNHLLHSLELSARYARAGYRLRLAGSVHRRSDWKAWGLPDNAFDQDTEQFERWSASLAKTYSLKGFKKVGLEVEYLGGANLDRFSKYQFGYFDASRVHGYQSELVRAEEALGVHGTYGFEIGELLRLDLVGDAVWATDVASGLDNELLGGAGIAGTFIGPWQTVINLDFGVPVTGPDDGGFTLFLAILKLFR